MHSYHAFKFLRLGLDALFEKYFQNTGINFKVYPKKKSHG